ncbi:MAG: HIRAN domain-containing protein [Coriobacteriaceae bacterium]|nr:HIRAN domain-containing protein [Coriobacteriaceae bacterium]
MYEPSRNLFSFHIAGFQFYDGALVLSELKAGDALDLVPEPDNPHDSEAIAIKCKGVKLGYVPSDMNAPLAVMMHYGHASVFECRVLQVAPERSPWHQVRAAVFVKDAR